MPLSSKCIMHFRWPFIFSTYGLCSLPSSNFAPFEEVTAPVSNSAEFSSKNNPLEDFAGFGVVRVNGNVHKGQVQGCWFLFELHAIINTIVVNTRRIFIKTSSYLQCTLSVSDPVCDAATTCPVVLHCKLAPLSSFVGVNVSVPDVSDVSPFTVGGSSRTPAVIFVLFLYHSRLTAGL